MTNIEQISNRILVGLNRVAATEQQVLAQIDQIILNLDQGVYRTPATEVLDHKIVMRENGRVVAVGVTHRAQVDAGIETLLAKMETL